MVSFSLYINSILPIIASATASMRLMPQIRCLLKAPLLGPQTSFLLPIKHFPPAQPQAPQTPHDPHGSTHHHPCSNSSASGLKPGITPSLIGCHALSAAPLNTSLLCPLLSNGQIWKSTDSRLASPIPAWVYNAPRGSLINHQSDHMMPLQSFSSYL